MEQLTAAQVANELKDNSLISLRLRKGLLKPEEVLFVIDVHYDESPFLQEYSKSEFLETVYKDLLKD